MRRRRCYVDCRRSGRQWLARSRENLSGAWRRRYRACCYSAGSQRRMQWRAGACEWGPHWSCWLAPNRFLHGRMRRTILGRRRYWRFRHMHGSALRGDHRSFGLWGGDNMGLFFHQLRFSHRGGRSIAFRMGDPLSMNALAHQFRHRLINRTGVRLLFGDADLRQHFYDHVRWNLQLPRQLVDADFAHI